ncbi:hypothetical protein HIM_06795 [Hirsutella minnesotensis 3608]|uniref:Uncharacterized protein n=1 Tax=Hirsutella minnesotensis 3608 TaxID=1043627 RepID=A0A0F7ZZA9_9HYPO|nr:hypothetical protein HIM_06795 [Hirsutella minnesotensis 3608]
MAPAFEALPASAATAVASYAITASQHLAVEVGQAEHRIQLVNNWRIPAGSRLLEIGCGQGTCTAVLAEVVGSQGHIDAVDPGAPDYGAPVTLAQAQAHLSAGPMGSRIEWHHGETADLLARCPDKSWDFAVLAHSIWYFSSPETLSNLLLSLKGRVGAVLVAEYALTATHPHALPHVLAAIARGSLEAHNTTSEANIRSLLSPHSIRDVSETSGWKLDSDAILTPNEALLDGSWETSAVLSKDFDESIEAGIGNVNIKAVLRSSREAVIGAVRLLKGSKVRTMDVWVARFSPVG